MFILKRKNWLPKEQSLSFKNWPLLRREAKVKVAELLPLKVYPYTLVAFKHVRLPRYNAPTLFNIFLERIMSDALEEHDGKVSIGGRNITNLWFADDIDALAEEEQELGALVESLDKTCTRYKMEISAEKTKLVTNSANGIRRDIKVKRQKLATVTSFKYLRAVVSDEAPNQRFSHGLHKPLQLLQS